MSNITMASTTSDLFTSHMIVSDVIFSMISAGIQGNDNATEVMTVPEGCIVLPFSKNAIWKHPEDLVSWEVAQKFANILNVYLLTIFFLLSAPLNIVNMIVFWRHGLRERINTCLFFLALADFIVVTGHFEWGLDDLYAAVTNTPYKPVIAKANINNMIHSLAGFIYISGFMTTLIAFERCLCVVSPLKAHGLIQLRTIILIIAFGHAIIFGGHYVLAARYQVICMFDPFIHQSIDQFHPTQFYFDNKALVDALDGILFGILLPGFFVIGVSLCTCVIVLKLRQMKIWRAKSSSADTTGGAALRDLTLTRMLIATNVLFVACTTPPLVFHTLLPFYPDLSFGGKYTNTYTTLLTVQQMCTYINSSTNFFFYYTFGTKFRSTVHHMFCSWCRGKDGKLLGGRR